MTGSERDGTPVAIGGLGTVGRVVAEHLIKGVDGYRLTAVSSGDRDRARDYLAGLGGGGVEVTDNERLADLAEVVVECAPPKAFTEIAGPVVEQGKTLVTINAGALLHEWSLVDAAASTGATIHIPTGALLALDAVQSAAQGTIHSVRMVTRKPPAALRDTPYVAEHGLDLSGLTEPLKLFEGNVRDVIVGFPSNLNVAVALALAGIGPDETLIEVWADPGVDRNTHAMVVDADSARMEFTIANVQSTNYVTPNGKLVALSVVALLRKLSSPLRIGT